MARCTLPPITFQQVNNRIFFYNHEIGYFAVYDFNENLWLNPQKNWTNDWGFFNGHLPNYWRDMIISMPNLIDRITMYGYSFIGRDSIKDNKNFIGTTERIYKVAESFFSDDPYTMTELLANCVECGVYLQTTNDVSEKEVIEYINAKKRNAVFYDLIGRTRWFKIEKMLNQYLPPLEFDEDEKKMATRIVEEYPHHVKRIAKILSTHFISNFREMLGIDRMESHIGNYLKWCDALDKEPSFSGNFIKKYAEMKRLYKDKEDELIAKAMRENQQKRELVFSAHGLTVVVPLTLEELIEEGHAQHNCVGEYGYNESIAEGERYIVFIRDENDIEQSLVTCEIDACDGEIVQFLLAYNNELYECEDSKLRERLEAYQDSYQEYLFNMWKEGA